jgi:hypothetical protein
MARLAQNRFDIGPDRVLSQAHDGPDIHCLVALLDQVVHLLFARTERLEIFRIESLSRPHQFTWQIKQLIAAIAKNGQTDANSQNWEPSSKERIGPSGSSGSAAGLYCSNI